MKYNPCIKCRGFLFMEISALYNIYLEHPVISTDSRKISRGCIFFALRGDNFDGNVYATSALQEGAAYAIVDNPEVVAGPAYILVHDVLQCLQELASFHRQHLHIPVLAITGSNGKTTTKELCRDVLRKKLETYATFGNLNNHIGVPLTILSVGSNVQFVIVEMGANHQGEIAQLCQIAKPDYVMITNIGKAHMEGFGGIEGIKKGKSEMYRYAEANGAQIFINSDDSVLKSLIPAASKIIPYSVNETVKVMAPEPSLQISYSNQIVITQMYGEYNVPNIGFAIALGRHFGIADDQIADALSQYTPESNRSQITKSGNNTVIKDAYNANPSSMQASLISFSKMAANVKIVVLGDMLELGEYANEEHKKIINLAKQLRFDHMIFIGPLFMEAGKQQKGHYFENVESAKIHFAKADYNDALILLKGSRGIAVEKILY